MVVAAIIAKNMPFQTQRATKYSKSSAVAVCSQGEVVTVSIRGKDALFRSNNDEDIREIDRANDELSSNKNISPSKLCAQEYEFKYYLW